MKHDSPYTEWFFIIVIFRKRHTCPGPTRTLASTTFFYINLHILLFNTASAALNLHTSLPITLCQRGDKCGDGGISGLCFVLGGDCYGFDRRRRVIGGQQYRIGECGLTDGLFGHCLSDGIDVGIDFHGRQGHCWEDIGYRQVGVR
uniref:Uncharacterized protein n=1 Tax=Romanomermis culicivorax TaxID=13658 RepID=A0A915KX76_ROMCU